MYGRFIMFLIKDPISPSEIMGLWHIKTLHYHPDKITQLSHHCDLPTAYCHAGWRVGGGGYECAYTCVCVCVSGRLHTPRIECGLIFRAQKQDPIVSRLRDSKDRTCLSAFTTEKYMSNLMHSASWLRRGIFSVTLSLSHSLS